jgi:hypothetical protein
MAPIVAATFRGCARCKPRIRGAKAQFRVRILRFYILRTIRSTPVRRNFNPKRATRDFGYFLKASMVGFTLVSRSYYTGCG